MNMESKPVRGGAGSKGKSRVKSDEARAFEERKLELLALARRSRVKWVTEAIDSLEVNSRTISVSNNSNNSGSKPSRVAKTPAEDCIQSVLEYLSDIIDDGERVDIDAVLSLIPSEHDVVDEASSVPDSIPTYEDANGVTRPAYAVFIDKLKHVGAVEIVKSMQYFVMKFEQMIRTYRLELMTEDPFVSKSITDLSSATSSLEADAPIDSVTAQKVNLIWEFVEKIQTTMRTNFLWAEESDAQWEKTKSSCEKFLFIKLYPYLFASDVEDSHLDKKLSDRISSLSFLTAEHLDIRYLQTDANNNCSTLAAPVAMLSRLAIAKSPSDKFSVLKRTSMLIANALKEARVDGSLPGADEFLPMMILTIKECNPPQINSTIKYLQRYTHPSKIGSESGYLLVHFISAVQFLEVVDARALTISPEEFDRSMKKSIDKAEHLNRVVSDKHQHLRNSLLQARGEFASATGSRRNRSSAADALDSVEADYDASDIRYRYYGPAVGAGMPSSPLNSSSACSSSSVADESGYEDGSKQILSKSSVMEVETNHKSAADNSFQLILGTGSKSKGDTEATQKAIDYESVLNDLIAIERKLFYKQKAK